MKFETLYKTQHPEKLEFAEYYQPQLETQPMGGRWVYLVRERHGWFSDQEKRPVHHTYTLNPEEGFATFEEALNRYNEQLQHRALEGFIHSFYIDVPVGHCYRKIDTDRISADFDTARLVRDERDSR
jgi:hypothetical protein